MPQAREVGDGSWKNKQSSRPFQQQVESANPKEGRVCPEWKIGCADSVGLNPRNSNHGIEAAHTGWASLKCTHFLFFQPHFTTFYKSNHVTIMVSWLVECPMNRSLHLAIYLHHPFNSPVSHSPVAILLMRRLILGKPEIIQYQRNISKELELVFYEVVVCCCCFSRQDLSL